MAMRSTVMLALLAMAAWTAVTRLHTLAEPLEQDVAVYAVIAHEMLDGRRLYSDLWDHKPPAIHATYAAAELITGYGPHTVHLLGVAATLVATLGVRAVALAVTGSPGAALWAAAFWTLVAGEMDLQANQPNTEVFITAATAWALALLLPPPTGAGRWPRAALSGVLFALASLYKPVAAAVAALTCVAHVVFSPAGTARRRALAHAAIGAGVAGGVWGALILYFAATGRLEDFVQAVFTFNRWYGGDIPSNLAAGLAPTRLVPPFAPGLGALAALGVLGVAGAETPMRRMVVVAWLAGTYVAVASPGQWYPHYYQLWLAPLAVAAGLGVDAIRRWRPHLATPIGAAALAWLLALVLPEFAIPPDGWSRLKYGEAFVTTDRVGALIDRALLPTETFYVWANAPGMYFVAGKRPPTGVIYVRPLVEGPLAARLSARVLGQLTRARPDLVLVASAALSAGPANHPVLEWIAAQYRRRRVATEFGTITFFVRPGSALEQRLGGSPSGS